MTSLARPSTSRRRARRLVGTLAALTLAGTALAALPAQAADTGSITGKVFTKAVGGSNVPAGSVFIYLSYSPTINGGYDSVDSDPSTPSTNGFSFTGNTFALTGLKAGYYKFEVAGVGDEAYQREYYNDKESLSGATPVQVGTGATAVDDMVLEPAGQITGKVTDRAGKPLANASVSFADSENGGGGYATTDANGNFTSQKDDEGFGVGLVRGSYRVSAYFDDYTDPDAPSYEQRYWQDSATYAAATPVTVTPGATASSINIKLDVAPRLRLTVKDPSGTPLPDTNVGIYVFYDGEWGPYRAGPNRTDENGVYRRTLHIGDRYKFFIDPPAGVGGVKEWYDNAYSEATAKEVTATAHGQVIDITIQLGAAPTDPTTPTTPNSPTTPAPSSPAPVAVPQKFAPTKVSVRGTAKVGKKLRASTRAWAPAPVKLSYTWYRNGKRIKGQTKSTYTLRTADTGKRITVRVQQRKAGYATASRLSAKTAKVKRRQR
jgi:hypothetical protein